MKVGIKELALHVKFMNCYSILFYSIFFVFHFFPSFVIIIVVDDEVDCVRRYNLYIDRAYRTECSSNGMEFTNCLYNLK